MATRIAGVLVNRHRSSLVGPVPSGPRYRNRHTQRQPGGIIEHARWLLLVPVLYLVWTHGLATAGWAFQKAEAGGQFRLQARVIALIVREGVARAFLQVVSPLGWFHRSPRRRSVRKDPGPDRPPVLLIPGIGYNRSSLQFLQTFLRHRGWSWVWSINRTRSNGSPIAKEAAHVAQAIEALKVKSGASEVDVVAFSAGGLAAAWALRHVSGTRDSVRRLVTLATPWRGTKLAVFGPSSSHREIRYGSPIIDGLWPEEFDVVCIWSPDDPVIVPADSAAPELGAAGTDVCIEAAGHVELLVSSRALRATQAALERT